MEWQSQNGRICAETGRRKPPESGLMGDPLFCVLPTEHGRYQRRKQRMSLLVAQGHHGIDFAGAAGGNIAGGERDQGEQDRDSGKG